MKVKCQSSPSKYKSDPLIPLRAFPWLPISFTVKVKFLQLPPKAPAFVVPSALNAFPADTREACSCPSYWSSFKCRLLSKTSHDHPIENYHLHIHPTAYPLPCFIFIHCTCRHVTYCIFYFPVYFPLCPQKHTLRM